MPKEQTPKDLRQALDFVRGGVGAAPESLRGLSPLEATHIKRVRTVFEDPHIVAVGIAEQVTERKPTGELSLCFYVEKKRAKAKLKLGHMIPPVMSVANRTAVFTDVQQIGKLRLEANRRAAPLQSGFSVGRGPDTGTLGYPGDVDCGGAKPQPVGALSDFIAFNKTQDNTQIEAS